MKGAIVLVRARPDTAGGSVCSPCRGHVDKSDIDGTASVGNKQGIMDL